MKNVEQVKQDPAFMALDASTRARVLDIVSDGGDTAAEIEALIRSYNDAEKRRDFTVMSAAQSQIKKLKAKEG